MSNSDLGHHRSAKKPPFLPAILAGLVLVPGHRPHALAADGPLTSETTWQLLDDFDGVQRSWHISRRESLRRVLSHRRTDHSPRHGLRCEYLAVFAEKGDERIYATHPIPPSMAIREFQASVWLRGNRPGFQLMARVRLPRTVDHKTGEPRSLLVEGDAYVAVGHWQRLSLGDVDQALADKTRALRAELGRHVDPAEAYVDLVVLNMYGGAGTNRMWVDDLMLAGVVPSRRVKSDEVRQVGFHSSKSAPRVQEENGLLLVENQAWMPRIVQFHGEPFHLLEQLGFNCVWLTHPATDQQMAKARKHNLWLICPAPDRPANLGNFDRVLAWCVGRDATAGEIAHIQALAREIRSRDVQARPLVMSAVDHHDVWFRHVDIVVDTGPAVLLKSDSGQIIWKTIPLQGPERVVSWLDLRRQVDEAIAGGYKGFVMSAQRSLQHPSSRRKRQLMELLNMELELLQPWAMANQLGAVQATSNAGEYRVTVLGNGHTELALVRRQDQHTCSVSGRVGGEQSVSPRGLAYASGRCRFREKTQHTDTLTTVLIPTSRCHAAFLVETDRLSPLTPRRVAGGVSVSLPGMPTSAKILFTDQSNVIRHLTRHLRGTASRAHELLLDIARGEVLELDRMISQLVRSEADQADLRRRMHRMHVLLPRSAGLAEREITARQLETVFLHLDGMRRTLLTPF